MQRLFALVFLLTATSIAYGQTPPPYPDMPGMAPLYDDAIARDTTPPPEGDVRAVVFEIPGPEGGGLRRIAVWRPPGHEGVLPVLYMMDGFSGLTLVAHQIAPAIARHEAPAVMIIAPEPHPYQRTREYVPPYRERQLYFARHRDWVVNRLMPWAEQAMGASRQRTQRAIGGISNGGDFAVAMAAHRPDLFGLILVHAPANPRDEWVLPSSATQRWVITGGTRDFDGEVARTLERQLAPYAPRRRVCIGGWEHEPRPWRELSRGSTMWLFGYEDIAARMDTERERENCITRED